MGNDGRHGREIAASALSTAIAVGGMLTPGGAGTPAQDAADPAHEPAAIVEPAGPDAAAWFTGAPHGASDHGAPPAGEDRDVEVLAHELDHEHRELAEGVADAPQEPDYADHADPPPDWVAGPAEGDAGLWGDPGGDGGAADFAPDAGVGPDGAPGGPL